MVNAALSADTRSDLYKERLSDRLMSLYCITLGRMFKVHVCSLSECVWAVRDLLTEICEFCLEVVRTFDTTAVFVVGLLSQKKKTK